MTDESSVQPMKTNHQQTLLNFEQNTGTDNKRLGKYSIKMQ